ncbi:MAG: hypothetical protein EB075_06950 [Bacteroidetes bacterium]|nr:hypothetical protein [Bacteroidota bacterium]
MAVRTFQGIQVAPVRDAGRYEPLVRIFRAVDVDSSGWITVSVHPSGAGADPNPFLSGIWVFDVDVPVSIEEIIDGSASAIARQTIDAGNDWHAYRPGRVDIQRITPPEGAPVMVDVITQRRLDVTPYGLELEGRPFLETDPIAERIDATPQGFRLYLPATSEATLAVYHGSVTKRFEGRSAAPTSQAQVAEVWQTYRKAHSLPLSVPEPSLQHQLAVNWDNVYRMVDQVDGNRHYHIGPSVYRGLWIGDATKTARAMVMLADTAGVRQLTETMRQYVLPSGQFKLMVPHTLYRETAIYVRLLALYAQHSGNADWLLARWPDVQRAIAFMEDLNATTFEDPSTLYYGLFPPGFTDGGLAGVNPEYSSTLYALGALHVALRAIDQFQIDEPRAQAWQAFRDRLAARYAEARDRDQITDRFGNAFVPMKMGPNGSSDRPTMAQWAVLEGVNYSGVYRGDEPIVQSTLSMFDAHRSQGLVRGVGWLEDGLWPWVSMLEGVTRVHIGDADEAIRQLYATANHTNLLGVWVEEQPPLGVSRRNGGDVSSATASALHLGLVRTMLVNERPDTLHLLPAFPSAWLQPGLETRITPTLTWWGAMDLVVSVTEDGSSAQIEWDLDLHAHGRAPAIRLHTGAIAEAGFDVAGIDTSLPLSGRISVPTFR